MTDDVDNGQSVPLKRSKRLQNKVAECDDVKKEDTPPNKTTADNFKIAVKRKNMRYSEVMHMQENKLIALNFSKNALKKRKRRMNKMLKQTKARTDDEDLQENETIDNSLLNLRIAAGINNRCINYMYDETHKKSVQNKDTCNDSKFVHSNYFIDFNSYKYPFTKPEEKVLSFNDGIFKGANYYFINKLNKHALQSNLPLIKENIELHDSKNNETDDEIRFQSFSSTSSVSGSVDSDSNIDQTSRTCSNLEIVLATDKLNHNETPDTNLNFVTSVSSPVPNFAHRKNVTSKKLSTNSNDEKFSNPYVNRYLPAISLESEQSVCETSHTKEQLFGPSDFHLKKANRRDFLYTEMRPLLSQASEDDEDFDDDAISLSAGSISSLTSTAKKRKNMRQRHNPTSKCTTAVTQHNVHDKIEELEKNNPAVTNKNAHAQSTDKNNDELEKERHVTSNERCNNENDTRSNTTAVDSGASTKTPNRVPFVFKKVCVRFFRTGVCGAKNCSRRHSYTNTMRMKLTMLPIFKLTEAYAFVKTAKLLLELSIIDFIETFEKLRCRKNLLAIIEDVLQTDLNKTNIVKRIISGLISMGFSLQDVVDDICATTNTNGTFLSDILLDVIFQDTISVCNNWGSIQTLLKIRKEPVDFGLIEEIMAYSCETENVELAKRIFTDIFEPRRVDSKLISTEISKNFIAILRRNLHYDDEALHQIFENDAVTHEELNFEYSRNSFDNFPIVDDERNNMGHFGQPVESYSPITTELAQPSDTSAEIIQKDVISPSLLNDSFSAKEFGQQHERSTIHTNFSTSSESSSNDRSSSSTSDSEDSNFQCDENLTENQLLTLKEIIDEGGKLQLLEQIFKFKNTSRATSFVVETIVLLKSKTAAEIYDMFFSLIDGLESIDPNYTKNLPLMSMLEMLCVNILAILENKNSYQDATNILLKFCGDIRGLVETKWINGHHRYDYSEAGKYIYICKVFVKGLYLQGAWKILTSPELNLMCHTNEWKVKNNNNFDCKLRNLVIINLISLALTKDVLLAKTVILHILQTTVIDIDMWKYFNKLLVAMLENKEDFLEDIKGMLRCITESWYKHVAKPVMRGLLICLATEISDKEIVDLYDRCCNLKCYPQVHGNESRLVIVSDMEAAEIYILLHVYFYKKIKNQYPLTDMYLHLVSPTNLNHQHPSVFLHTIENIKNLKTKVYSILASAFYSPLIIDYNNSNDKYIVIKEMSIKKCFEFYAANCKNF